MGSNGTGNARVSRRKASLAPNASRAAGDRTTSSSAAERTEKIPNKLGAADIAIGKSVPAHSFPGNTGQCMTAPFDPDGLYRHCAIAQPVEKGARAVVRVLVGENGGCHTPSTARCLAEKTECLID